MGLTFNDATSFVDAYLIKNAIKYEMDDVNNERVRYAPSAPERQTLNDKLEALSAAYVDAADVLAEVVEAAIKSAPENQDELTSAALRLLESNKIAEPRQLNSPLDPNEEIKYSNDWQMIAEAVAKQIRKFANGETDWGY